LDDVIWLPLGIQIKLERDGAVIIHEGRELRIRRNLNVGCVQRSVIPETLARAPALLLEHVVGV
jgi:hypothetical protein